MGGGFGGAVLFLAREDAIPDIPSTLEALAGAGIPPRLFHTQ